MALHTLIDCDASPILDVLHRDFDAAEIVSLRFRAKVPPIRSINDSEQWLRLHGILGCAEVYGALGINSLGIDIPASFHYATRLETIGTLANLLVRCGVHRQCGANIDEALSLAKTFLDQALSRQYDLVEAYSASHPWCDWFFGEGFLDETVLIGNRDEWWLLAVTWAD